MRSPEYVIDCSSGAAPLEEAELASEYREHQDNPHFPFVSNNEFDISMQASCGCCQAGITKVHKSGVCAPPSSVHLAPPPISKRVFVLCYSQQVLFFEPFSKCCSLCLTLTPVLT